MNLTKTSAYVKRFFKFLFIFVGSYYLLTLVIFPGSIAIIRAIFVKKIPFNPAYGQMEQLVFSPKRIKNDTIEIVLDTNDAKLPEKFPDRMTVYKFIPQQYSYLAGKNAQEDALVLGFSDKDLTSDLSGTIYKWRNSVTSSNLTIDINSRKLELKTTNLEGKGSSFSKGSVSVNSAKEKAKNILSSIYRFNDDLYTKGTQKVRLGTYSGSKIQETKSSTEAQLALVDFYRSIGNYPILGPDPDKGLMRIIVSGKKDKVNPLNNPLVEADYWEINTQSKAEYPIITPQTAWDIVRTGGGVISSIVPKNSSPFVGYTTTQVDKIYIDNIYLAYYETPEFQFYLQPIYVFSGTYTSRGSEGGNITIYFPAITAEFSKQSTITDQ